MLREARLRLRRFGERSSSSRPASSTRPCRGCARPLRCTTSMTSAPTPTSTARSTPRWPGGCVSQPRRGDPEGRAAQRAGFKRWPPHAEYGTPRPKLGATSPRGATRTATSRWTRSSLRSARGLRRGRVLLAQRRVGDLLRAARLNRSWAWRTLHETSREWGRCVALSHGGGECRCSTNSQLDPHVKRRTLVRASTRQRVEPEADRRRGITPAAFSLRHLHNSWLRQPHVVRAI